MFGAGFALLEGVAVLREVLLRYDVSLPDPSVDPPKVRNITSVPSRGARIVVQPRGYTAAGRPGILDA